MYEFQYGWYSNYGFTSIVWKNDHEEHLYFWSISQMIKMYIYMLNATRKTWINENNICQRITFSRCDMQRKPIQIWFWAMNNKCIMYLKSDWTYFQPMLQYFTKEETRFWFLLAKSAKIYLWQSEILSTDAGQWPASLIIMSLFHRCFFKNILLVKTNYLICLNRTLARNGLMSVWKYLSLKMWKVWKPANCFALQIIWLVSV